MNTPDANSLDIHFATSVADALRWRDIGYCPIECSFGEDSVTDALGLDHHGLWSEFEPVALRAWRDRYGSRARDPRFVVTGAADADATFAIASLAALIPGPPHPLAGAMAEAVSRCDLNPFAELWHESDVGRRLLLFKKTASHQHDAVAFYAGVERWRWLLAGYVPAPFLAAIAEEEHLRRQRAREALATAERISPEVAFVSSPVWGWDVWYAELAPVIVAYLGRAQRASIGVATEGKAHELFGPRGLGEIFPHLQPEGWGGRATIGGSPRDRAILREDAQRAAQTVAGEIVRMEESLPPAQAKGE